MADREEARDLLVPQFPSEVFEIEGVPEQVFFEMLSTEHPGRNARAEWIVVVENARGCAPALATVHPSFCNEAERNHRAASVSDLSSKTPDYRGNAGGYGKGAQYTGITVRHKAHFKETQP